MTMKISYDMTVLAAGAVAMGFLAGCSSTETASRGVLTTDSYDVSAYRPSGNGQVRVKVSTSNQAVYVMEGSEPLLVSAINVGKPGSPTPKGNFRVTGKEANRRNRTYGMWVRGQEVVGGKSSQRPPGSGWKFIGYPMPYWVEFLPAYGFHAGFVHLAPRSHGCIRIPRHVAPKFFQLVQPGTPINIATTQPEDATLGANLDRPDDRSVPDPPVSFMASQQPYSWHNTPVLQ